MGIREGVGSTKIEQLVDYLLSKVKEVAQADDWEEADGWIGKWEIIGEGGFQRVYEITRGQFIPTHERDESEYKGAVTMSVDTFLDLFHAALRGRGEDVFLDKYRSCAIKYRGESWLVDSERFRRVLQNMGNAGVRGLLRK